MEILSESAFKKQTIFTIYFNLVEKAVPYILQFSAKKLKAQSSELFKAKIL